MKKIVRAEDVAKYHTKCCDCGRFLKKDRWVVRGHRQNKHGLCPSCAALYDSADY